MWREFIPVELKNYFNLINNKRRFPGRTILSHAINKEVALGRPCGIYKNVVLEKKVEIGAYSYINAGTRIGENVKIGKYCSIAYNCQIGMNEHPISFVSTSPHTFGKENIFKEQISWEDFNKKVLIGNDVWIGSNTVIMQGVNIGNGAIIAAGAVVTKDVQPYSIVAGVPAKEIKKRFGDEKVSYLQNLKWWDMSENELQQYKDIFTAGEEWAEHLD